MPTEPRGFFGAAVSGSKIFHIPLTHLAEFCDAAEIGEWSPEEIATAAYALHCAADNPVRVSAMLLRQLLSEGVDFRTNVNGPEWDAQMTSWALNIAYDSEGPLSTSRFLHYALGIIVHAGRWCEAQMANPASILNAWQTSPGRAYFTDGVFP